MMKLIHLKEGNHFALGVKDMDLAESFLEAWQGIPFTTRQTRPDGAFQIYCEDPDGFLLDEEFCQFHQTFSLSLLYFN